MIILTVLTIFSVLSMYCYYLGYTGKNKYIQRVLAKRSIWFFFVDFLIMTTILVGVLCVLL